MRSILDRLTGTPAAKTYPPSQARYNPWCESSRNRQATGGMPVSEADISALYGLPLAEFTSARNELAKQARALGDAEQADAIKALKKPSLPAWALNMLPRLREAELAEVLEAGERAEAAQAGVLARTADAGELRQASDQLRRSARTLAREAGEILVKGGHAAREETQLRVAQALEATAVTSEGRRQLLKGEFEEAPEAAGFGAFAQLPTIPKHRASKAKPDGRRDQAEARRAAQQAVEDAQAELADRRAERAEAEAATRDAERAARAKQREAEQARQAVERSRERAERAQAAELEAKKRLDEAKERLRAGRG